MSKHDFEIFRLEDRVLFEAAAAAEIVDAAVEVQNDPNANTNAGDRAAQENQNAVKNAPPEDPAAAILHGNVQNQDIDPADVDGAINALIEGVIPAGDAELVVVNKSVQDIAAISSSLNANQQLLVLDSGNGLQQLNDFLDTADTQFSAIHLLTHGKDGALRINGETIDTGNFDAGTWSEIGEHLAGNGDIMIYGCETAASSQGVSLLQMIADASGCDVAASDDATGISGDWQLEHQLGRVETSALNVAGYAYDLAPVTVTVDTADDVVDDTDAFTSLREAIAEAAHNGGEYIINFANNISTIKLDASRGALMFEVNYALEMTVDGDVDADGIADVTISGEDSDSQIMNVFLFEDFTLNLQNLTLTSGSGTGIQGGAIAIDTFDCDVTFNMDNVAITNSSADDGGAVRIAGWNIDLAMVNSTIYGNSADVAGGALLLSADNELNVDIVNSTITGNNSELDHSALDFKSNAASSVNVINSIIAGNSDKDILLHSDTIALSMSHTIYDSVHDDAGEVTVTGTGNVQVTDVSTIFETGTLDSDNRSVAIKNDSVAAYGGTLVNAADFSATIECSEAILDDQTGAARDKVLTQLGVAEFAIGAVAPKTTYLKVTPVDRVVVYNGALHQAENFTCHTAGGTEVTALPAATVLSAASTATSLPDVGTYTVTTNSTVVMHNGSDVSDTYDFDWQSGKIEITPKELTVTANAQNLVYGGVVNTTDYTVTGWVSGDETFLGELVIENAAYSSGGYLNVGTYNLLDTALSVSANYFITYNKAVATVSKLSIDSTGINVTTSKVYDGSTNADYSGTLSGVLAGDVVDLTAKFDYDTANVGINKNISASAWSISGVDAGNYDLQAFTTLTNGVITPKELTVTANAQNLVYGGVVNTTDYTVTGWVSGDETALGELVIENAAYSSGGYLNVGTYNLLDTALSVSANYFITYNKAAATVSKLSIDSTGINVTTGKVYDGSTNADYSGTLSGVLAGDVVDLTAKFDYDTVNVGINKNISASAWSISGVDAGNYDLQAFATLTNGVITPKELTVTAHNQQIRYGGTADLNNYTVTGWVSGDETALGELVIADPVYIAGYLATGNYVLAGSALQTPANYTINYQPGILSVVGKMPSRINEDMFGQGVQNPGYSGTMAALRSSIYAGNFGNSYTLGNDNPDAMTYAGLVSHEINALGKVVSADAGVLRISVDAMPRSEAISFDDLIFDSYDGETQPGIIVDELDIPDVMLGEELD